MRKPKLEKLMIWGASGHARVVADIVRLMGKHRIVGFVDEISPARNGEEFLGATVIGGDRWLAALKRLQVKKVIVAVGDCAARLRLSCLLEHHGFDLIPAVHPRAVVAGDAGIGPGAVVCAGAVVGPGVRLGKCSIVNTSASVDHDSVIEDAGHVGPGAHLGGRVHVGRGAWVAIGAAVVDNVVIGEGALVGAGAVVIGDVPARTLVLGVPARRKAPVPGSASFGHLNGNQLDPSAIARRRAT